jgi:hypothetical protein
MWAAIPTPTFAPSSIVFLGPTSAAGSKLFSRNGVEGERHVVDTYFALIATFGWRHRLLDRIVQSFSNQ